MAPRRQGSKSDKRGGAAARLKRGIAKREPLQIAMRGPTGKDIVIFRPGRKQPSIMSRNLQLLQGSRNARRPGKLARLHNAFSIAQVAWADEYEQPDTWEEAEDMPDENRIEDCNWEPGPVQRKPPKFHGRTPGPSDASITHASPVSAFLNTQLTRAIVQKIVQYTIEHCEQWRSAHPDWRKNCIECSVKRPRKQFTVNQVHLWLAARLRLAQLKPEIPAYSLWDKSSSLFDVQVFAAMTFNQFQWINRHASFADVPRATAHNPDDTESDSDVSDQDVEEESHEDADDVEVASDDDQQDTSATPVVSKVLSVGDPHRKRRELTDLACTAFGAAWYPHQFLGVDEAVRAHKHWGKMRIRFKAAVHSGSLVDCLNDCVTKYTMWFEEQHWRKKSDEEDPNSCASRLCRAAETLFDPGKSISTSNYCISLDRGYGHIQAQEELAKRGIFSSAMIAANRVGLPRKYLEHLASELGSCPDKCTHDDEAQDCRRFTFTALHKKASTSSTESAQTEAACADWELCCWQDSQLLISFGNFFSTTRCGLLSRGSHGSKYSYSVWAPEAIWHYNIQGRSATDGADQLRKKMCLAERRIVRAGVKGMTFVFDLAFTNAAIMWQFLNRTQVSRSVLEKKFTKVR